MIGHFFVMGSKNIFVTLSFLTLLTFNYKLFHVLLVAAKVINLVELFYFVVEYLGILSLVGE